MSYMTMRLQLLPIALSAILFTACSAERAPQDADTARPVADQADTDASRTETKPPSLPEPGEHSDMPPASTLNGADNQARFDGYGDVKFGIAAGDMEKAWGGELKNFGGEGETCYFMTPMWVKIPAEFNFMINEGKFVRYGVDSAKMVAPGGGKIGMSKAEIGKLYAGRIQEQPHKYTDGLYLRIKDSGGGNGVLIFETDAKADTAKVTEWRVGVPPEVDYVEGCS